MGLLGLLLLMLVWKIASGSNHWLVDALVPAILLLSGALAVGAMAQNDRSGFIAGGMLALPMLLLPDEASRVATAIHETTFWVLWVGAPLFWLGMRSD